MKGPKNAKATPVGVSEDILDELFADSDDGARLRYDIVSSVAFGRLIAAVTGLGGVVTFYGGSTDYRFGITVGFGERKRRHTFHLELGFQEELERVANIYNTAWVRQNPGTLELLTPDKPKKGP